MYKIQYDNKNNQHTCAQHEIIDTKNLIDSISSNIKLFNHCPNLLRPQWQLVKWAESSTILDW